MSKLIQQNILPLLNDDNKSEQLKQEYQKFEHNSRSFLRGFNLAGVKKSRDGPSSKELNRNAPSLLQQLNNLNEATDVKVNNKGRRREAPILVGSVPLVPH
jgi:hypothetical protein